MNIETLTKEEVMQNVRSIKELARACSEHHPDQEIPFTVTDALLLCAVINHLAIAAKYN